MRTALARRVTVLILLQSLFCSVVLSQQQPRDESRPRRVEGQWPQPPVSTTPVTLTIPGIVVGPEPSVRIALATDARSAVISTSGHLMNASGGGTTLIALDTSRVRLEPHLLSPLPPQNQDDNFVVVVAAAGSRAEAEESAKEIKKLAGEECQAAYDTETKTWSLLVGPKRPREEAEELQARLEAAGVDATVSNLKSERTSATAIENPTAPPPSELPKNSSNVRLTSRTSVPSREVVAISGANRLLNSSAPLSFVSDDEKNAPIRYNDRPYRGRIEVFTNLRGNLTVVNELPLEDYVRGVVANELSPGGYPAIEALKAQAVAARTYALRNRGQFISQGFDLLPTTRSQVYRGLSSENSLSTRAVDETRGLVATYNGEPINALYTSTCGGRTENSESIFNDAVPYLRSRECAAEGLDALNSFLVKTTREPADLRDPANVPLIRDVVLLTIQNFNLSSIRISDSWLSANATVAEVRNWIANAARVAKLPSPMLGEDINRPPAFATALAVAVFGDSRASTLFNEADVDYLLAVRDATDVPPVNRADLALLIRDGYLSVYPDATMRPREPLSRGRVLHAIARVLEARNLLQLQKGNARSSSEGKLILRSTKGKDQSIRISADAFLFRQLGDNPYAVKSVAIVGGEPVIYHLGPNGEVDYLEVKPAPNGAAADRFSPFSNWTTGLSIFQVQARLGRYARGIGPIMDLRVASRGPSHRVTDLEVVGTNGTAHVRGGKIRSTLGLREQLFVIDRDFDEAGRVTEFTFSGRGWGHGVGMCQVGAYGLAKQGWSFEQILKAYYSGIEVTRIY